MEKAFDDHSRGKKPTVVSALYIEIASTHRGLRLSSRVLKHMCHIARSQGFEFLIALIRPSMKSYYPLIAIEDYVRWKNPDGRPFDPWLRVHMSLGGELLHVCESAMRVSGSREEWAKWTGLAFPGDGYYVVPHGLAPVKVRNGRGEYIEPGVWFLHRL
jgi:hypothetical protein